MIADIIRPSVTGHNLRVAARIIEADMRSPLRGPLLVQRIAAEVADKHDIPVALVLGRSRATRVTRARRELMRRLAAPPLAFTPTQIARWLEMNHSTVLYAIHRDTWLPRKRARRLAR